MFGEEEIHTPPLEQYDHLSLLYIRHHYPDSFQLAFTALNQFCPSVHLKLVFCDTLLKKKNQSCILNMFFSLLFFNWLENEISFFRRNPIRCLHLFDIFFFLIKEKNYYEICYFI